MLVKPCQFATIVLLSIKMRETVKCSFELKWTLSDSNERDEMKTMHTSWGKTNCGGAEKGHEFELRTIIEKSTRRKQ